MLEMLKRTIKAEEMKLKHSVIWLACIIIPIIAVFMGSFNYVQCLDQLRDGWYSLWTQHTIFYCYFCFPVLVGIYCAYVCRLEYMSDNWKNLLAMPVSVASLYWAKFIVVMKLLLLTQLWLGILFYASGKLVGITGSFPIEFIRWMFCGLVGSLSMASIQLCLAMLIRNFAVPVGIALVGGIAGLVARAMGLGLVCPYSLFAIGMCANDPRGMMGCSVMVLTVVGIMQMLIFSIIAIRRIKYYFG